MKYLLVVSLLLIYAVVGLFLRFSEEPAPSPTPTPYVFNSETMLSLISDWRIAHELSPVTQNEYLCEVANERAKEVQLDWSHDSFTASRVCREESCDVGENLGRFITPEGKLLTAWENSQTHLAVLNYPSYKYGCVAENSGYVVLLLSNINLK